MLCGISPAFAGLFPIGGQIAHVLRTRAPCAHPLYCYKKLRTRLACVKHAASVRSEPGSNSRLKPVAWRLSPFGDFAPLRGQKNPVCTGPACQAKLLVAQINSNYPSGPDPLTQARLEPEWGRTDSGTSYRLSKSFCSASLSSRVATIEPIEHSRCTVFVNSPFPPFFPFSTPFNSSLSL